MNSNPSAPKGLRDPRPGTRGIAIIIVLASIVLLTLVIVAFLVNVSSERSSSKVYASGTSVKLLAESAVNIVIAEINDATHNQNLCWASQPGMIRTYDNTATPVNYYKLYSDTGMVGTGPFDHTLAANLVPGNWYKQKGVYVDLNEPISVDGTSHYPIVDGNKSDLTATVGGTNVTLGQTVNSGTPQVAGFWLTPATPVQSATSNQAPMPVKWLYILKGGQTIVPDSNASGGNTVTFTAAGSNGAALSATNPIIGRIAFWTDDESCKININTASESAPPVPAGSTATVTGTYTGSFIDTPRVCTKYDESMAVYPAAQNEFQRYPGHPATVSLSTVFGSWLSDANYPECIYPLTPRTNNGGSKEGTVQYVTSYSGSNSAPAISLRPDRLYTTPDEFLFQPWSTASSPPRPLNSAPNNETTLTASPSTGLASSSELDQPTVEKSKFFITASSRAPDVNLFNLPRVCMWPISSTSDNLHRTPYDDLIAFCETTGTAANSPIYYFQRTSWSSTTEANTGRNSALIQFLRTLFGMPIPGFSQNSATFATKYATAAPAPASGPAGSGTEIDQILMEVFDYIRCVNLRDSSSLVPNFVYFSNSGTGGTPANPLPNDGIVVPSINSALGTKGFGRVPTISSANLLFIVAGDTNHVSYSFGTNPPATVGPAISSTNVRVQAALIFSLFDPSQGFWSEDPQVVLQVKPNLWWSPPTFSGSASMFPSGTINSVNTNGSDFPPWGGELGPRLLFGNYGSGTFYPFLTALPAKNAAAPYPDFPTSGGTINFGGGTVQVSLYVGNGALATKSTLATPATAQIQNFTFTFPSGTFPVPTLPPAAVNATTFNPCCLDNSPTLPGRFYFPNLQYPATIGTTDTVKGIICSSGDLRLVAGRYDPSTLFAPHPTYATGQPRSHNLIGPDGFIYCGATRGTLIPGGTSYWAGGPNTTGTGVNQPFAGNDVAGNAASTAYTFSCEPESTGTLTNGVSAGASTAPGDWDNGFGAVRDGPYINKADEGDIGYGVPTGGTFYPAYFGGSYSFTSGGAVQRSFNQAGSAYFSPARQMPSAGMLGSLPTGVFAGRPWQTLLFHPDYTGSHAGAQSPPDYLMLDFFHMPVVEPYAISEPLSTAGRINMNYLIVPFTYINRDTGVRAVLQSQQMLAIPNTASGAYTSNQYAYSTAYKQQLAHILSPNFITSPSTESTYRFSINPTETLKGFQARFNGAAVSPTAPGGNGAPDIFRSPAEICSLDLVPADTSGNAAYGQMQAYWQAHALTGDNSRERPYANIYPLLTTKSNVFTVHFRVQTLKKITQPGGGFQPTWVEGTDVITGEYRGSQTIERYIDPDDPRLGQDDYAQDLANSAQGATTPSVTTPLPSLYNFRTVSTRQFAP